jgi:formylglycine-generating enzyme required for sulfatase activity
VLLLDTRSGRYSVRKHDGPDSQTDVIAWTESPLVSRADGHNLVRIDAVGDSVSIYLNGQQLASLSAGDFPSGMLGFMVENVDATEPHIHFDNLAIWSTPLVLPDPGLPATRDSDAGQMVLIAGGPFVLGDNERDDARPHVIDLPSFYIDQTEVTNAAYAACVEAGACTPQAKPASEQHPNYASQTEYANYPALEVDWQQAAQFCQWAEKRLPTEAEWEKAASWSPAQEKVIWAFGNEFNPELLNSQEAGNRDTTAVDTYVPEVNNTQDMAGNVSEWTSSLSLPYPYNADDGREAADASGDRIYRGGSWAQTQGKARSALRQAAPIDYPSREIGFRCAVSP